MSVPTIDLHAFGVDDAKRAVGRLQPFGEGKLDFARRTFVPGVRRGLRLSKLAMSERDAGANQPGDEREG
jgi:hypothetical protein